MALLSRLTRPTNKKLAHASSDKGYSLIGNV